MTPVLDYPLHVVLLGAGLVSGVIVSLSIAALMRRRSWAYFLVTLALIVFLGRSVLAGLALIQVLSPESHHLLEHGMDLLTGGLLIGAIYVARTIERPIARQQ